MEKIHARATTDQTKIIKWTEKRGGKPAIVDTKEDARSTDGILKIKFSDSKNESLSTISWDNFFEIFENNQLEFLFQEATKNGDQSRFFKFIQKKGNH